MHRSGAAAWANGNLGVVGSNGAQGGRMVVIQNILMMTAHLLRVPFDVLKKLCASLKGLGETFGAHSYTTHPSCMRRRNAEATEELYWDCRS